MQDTTIISADALAEKYTDIYRSGGATDIKNFLFAYGLGIERGVQIAQTSNPTAA